MKHPDHYDTTPQIRKRMSRVHLRRGPLERKLARALWHRGVRYRLDYRALPGSPDIAITRYRIAVFVDGEFWHGYDWERRREKLRHDRAYWQEKIEENMARDRRNEADLHRLDWYVIRFWSKRVDKDPEGCADEVMKAIALRS